jgi:hypothetical protein
MPTDIPFFMQSQIGEKYIFRLMQKVPLVFLFDIILIIGKTLAICIYAVFDIKSDIAADAELVEAQPYIGTDFILCLTKL